MSKSVSITPPLILKAQNISKKFDRLWAFKDISIEMKRGEIIGFLGPNGAGKTTTMRVLSGYFPPSEGSVEVNGVRLENDPKKAKANIGYLPENISLYSDMRVKEFLHFVANIKGLKFSERKKHVEEKMKECGLFDQKHRLIGKLSKGFKQRVGIAQALIGDPDLLILDEPTSALDPKQITEIRDLIKQLGKERAIILSTHILPEVSMICDKVLMINQGKIIASGTVEELEKKMGSGFSVIVTVNAESPKEDVLKLLEDVPEIDQVTLKEENSAEYSYTCQTNDLNLRGKLVELFSNHKIPLIEIKKETSSLEDIFLKLIESND